MCECFCFWHLRSLKEKKGSSNQLIRFPSHCTHGFLCLHLNICMSFSLFYLSHPSSIFSPVITTLPYPPTPSSHSTAPSLITPPCPFSLSSSGPRVCHSVGPGGRFVRAAQEGSPSGGADAVGEGSAGVVHAVFPPGGPVHPSRSGWGSRHPCMWVRDLRFPRFPC